MAYAKTGIGNDRSEWLVDLVGNCRDQFSHRNHARDASEILLRFLQSLFGPLPILDVNAGPVPLEVAPLVARSRHFSMERETIFPVRPPKSCFSFEGSAARQRCAP